MEPPLGHERACRKSKKSAAKPSKDREKSERSIDPSILKKCPKKSRLKCDVCSRGFQKRQTLSRHRQSHFSGALSERYSEASSFEGRGSVARVQRYLTLNMAQAMKLRASHSFDLHKPTNRGDVNKEKKRKQGLKEPKLKQVKRNEKLSSVPKQKEIDRIQFETVPSAVLSEHDEWESQSCENPTTSSAIKGEDVPRTVLDIVTDPWGILDTDTTEVTHPQKLILKVEHKEADGYSDDGCPQAVTPHNQQALEEGIQSNKKKQARQLDALNQLGAVTAMHDGVVELVSSLQGEKDKSLTVPPNSHSDTEGVLSNKQARLLDSLNQMSAATAIHDGVMELVSSLQVEKDKCLTVPQNSHSDTNPSGAEAKSSSESSDGSASDIDDDNDPDYIEDSEELISEEKDHSPVKRRRNRAKSSTYCDICQKEVQNLPRHLFYHYGERNHKCKICGKAFFHARVLDKHETTHTKKFKCGVCGEMFSKARAAKKHAKIHLPDKPYSCEICQMAFSTRGGVRKHLLVHSEVKRYVCDICGQGRHTLTALNSHKRKHTGERPFVCEICGKSFRYSSGLRVHNFTHTSGKPYPCPICRESFAHNYLRKRHLLTHETDSVPEEDDQGEFSRSLSSAGHVVQDNEYLSLREVSPNSEVMASTCTSRLGDLGQTLPSAEEPLTQGDSADQATGTSHSQSEQPVPRPANQDNLQMCTEVKKINKILGPHSFHQTSRRETPADLLVVPLCDMSYKSLKDLQRQGIESDDL